MNKKKILSVCFTAVILLLCMTFSLGILVKGPSGPGANERQTPTPKLRNADGKVRADYLTQVSDWFSDHFCFRQELITLNNRLNAGVFGISEAPDVILGRNGWLYYGATAEDYTGARTMSGRELYCAAENLSLMARYCQNEDRNFLFMIAPNKNSLYNSQMPDLGAEAQERDAQRLMAILEDRGVPYLDLYPVFRQQEKPLYYAHDSHWTEQGAAVAADLILERFGTEGHFGEGPFTQEKRHDGDLYAMLYPAGTDPETEQAYSMPFTYTFVSKATKADSILLETASDRPGSLLVYRDSFGNNLYPYLAESFGSAAFSRSADYDLTRPGENVLVELVERNLSRLQQNLPVMPAPEESMELPEEILGEVSCSMQEDRNLLRTEGELPEVPDEDSPVWLICSGRIYREFCLEENRYGAYLPETDLPDGLLFRKNGSFRRYVIKN